MIELTKSGPDITCKFSQPLTFVPTNPLRVYRLPSPNRHVDLSRGGRCYRRSLST
jgi:hypothetical protein